MKNQYIAEKITAGSEAESQRLTNLEQDRLTKERSANLTAEIQKITSKRELKGDRIVFKSDEEFAKAGMDILRKYNATFVDPVTMLFSFNKNCFELN